MVLSLLQSQEDGSNIYDHVIRSCECFLGFMNAADDLKKGKSNGRKGGGKEKQARKKACRQSTDSENVLSTAISQHGSLSCCSLPSGGKSHLPIGTFHTSAGGKATEPLFQAEKDSDKLPNFHQEIHFDCVRKDNVAIWNCNGFWGEDKHQIFKIGVQSTNHYQPEKQLLLKEALLSTIRALMNGSFLHSDPMITVQIGRIQQSCPELMKSMLAPMDHTLNEKMLSTNVAEFKSHISLAVYDKLKQQYVKSLKLPMRCNLVDAKTFQSKMKLAMKSYKIDCTVD